MRYISGAEESKAIKYIEMAAAEALKSLCLRQRCGAVIVHGDEIIGLGFNSPSQDNPLYRTCLREYEIPPGFRHDRTCCIHAEQRAIRDVERKNSEKLHGSVMYFSRIDKEGHLEKSGKPKCTICSRTVLDVGISEVVLWHEEGVAVYDAAEFNELSYEYQTPLKIF